MSAGPGALTARPVLVAVTSALLLGAGLGSAQPSVALGLPSAAVGPPVVAVGPPISAAVPSPTLITSPPVDPNDAVVLPVEDVVAGSEDLVFAEASADGAVTDRGGREFILASDVLFAFNRATLTARARKEINRIAGVLTSGSGPSPSPGEAAKITAVTITGYTDDIGSDRYNLALSRRRALAVRAELVRSLGAGVAVTAVGRGEQDPVATNNTDRGRQANRRVEIRGR